MARQTSTKDSATAPPLAQPPIDAFSCIDLLFSGTFSYSSRKELHDLGDYFLQGTFETLEIIHRNDGRALSYLAQVRPTIGSALRALCVEAGNYKMRILPIEQARDTDVNDVTGKAIVNPLVKSLTDITSKSLSVYGLSVSLSIAAALVGYTVDRSAIAALIIVFALVPTIAFGLTVVSRWIRGKHIKRITRHYTSELNSLWGESFDRFEGILVDALIGTIRVQESVYPEHRTFHDGHLFPRPELPYPPPIATDRLSPASIPASEVVKRLRNYIQSRISSDPRRSRLELLEKMAAFQ